jgi:hypothetical protein
MGNPNGDFFGVREAPLIRRGSFHCYIDFSGLSRTGHFFTRTFKNLGCLEAFAKELAD